MERVILHCDCNSFYASVETLLRPELARSPMAVCGDPKSRHGIILAKNEKAKAYGVQTAETIWQALQKCPDLVLVSPHRSEYERLSYLANQIYLRYTDLVEPFGIDESWLDVTGSCHLFGTGPEIANRLRQEIERELGLTISVGVSFNKVFAKLGSDYKKPNATTVITRENFRSLLFPLPVDSMLFVGKAAKKNLESIYVRTIGDLAACEQSLLHGRLGKLGDQLYEYANGLDESPVHSYYEEREVKSIGNGNTFREDLNNWEEVYREVALLADTLAARMRRHGKKCTTLTVHIRDPGFRTISRQKPLENPTFLAKELCTAAMEILREQWKTGAPIRMLTLTGTGLVAADEAGEQLDLFGGEKKLAERQKQEELEVTVDRLRERFGKGAVASASALGRGGYVEEKDE